MVWPLSQVSFDITFTKHVLEAVALLLHPNVRDSTTMKLLQAPSYSTRQSCAFSNDTFFRGRWLENLDSLLDIMKS